MKFPESINSFLKRFLTSESDNSKQKEKQDVKPIKIVFCKDCAYSFVESNWFGLQCKHISAQYSPTHFPMEGTKYFSCETHRDQDYVNSCGLVGKYFMEKGAEIEKFTKKYKACNSCVYYEAHPFTCSFQSSCKHTSAKYVDPIEGLLYNTANHMRKHVCGLSAKYHSCEVQKQSEQNEDCCDVNQNVKACVTCKHHKSAYMAPSCFDICENENSQYTDIVDGRVKYNTCNKMREKKCGSSAKCYEKC